MLSICYINVLLLNGGGSGGGSGAVCTYSVACFVALHEGDSFGKLPYHKLTSIALSLSACIHCTASKIHCIDEFGM